MERGIDIKAIQAELLCMIKDIHKVCEDNGIQYSLTGGSLLGAVRESGFIPWDDDIDIMIDRTNYELLCKAIQNTTQFQMGRGPWLQHIRPNVFLSEIEPYVDVFILDNVPDSKWQASLKVLLLRLLQGMLKEEIEYAGFSSVYKVCIFFSHVLGKLFTRRFKLRLYDLVSQIGDSSTAKYMSITNDSFGLLKKKHESSLMSAFEIHPFENTKLMITKKYKEYLTVRYGSDYMTPPPVEERIVGQHANRPHVKNESEGI